MERPVGGPDTATTHQAGHLLGGEYPRPDVRNIQLSQDIAFLQHYGFDLKTLKAAQLRAEKFDITPAQALVSAGQITETAYYRCVAFELQLDFVPETSGPFTPLSVVPEPERLSRLARMIRMAPEDRQKPDDFFNLAPDCSELDDFKEHLDTHPNLRKRLRITTHTANKRCLEDRSSASILSKAINGLRDEFPRFSAKRVITAAQGVTLVLFIQLLIALSFGSSQAVVLGLHLTASFFYIGCTALRLIAFATLDVSSRTSPVKEAPIDRSMDHKLPVYSVLVALYQEEGQIDDLVDALLKLDWPRERLEIKLVCEADDLPTIKAVNAAIERVRTSCIALVEVPPAKPRTKPKALNYTLPLCSGRLLVIYDAEDRPNPLQLREAYSIFCKSPGRLACLQAPLIIHNHKEKWISRLFAVEYSALFDGLLPMLARIKAPLPLGGTSNHFKTSILRRMGGWDPYNVTEDADLGIRLTRGGYEIGVLRRPTYEEAPIDLGVWLRQRTRWFKGWYQTLLVHMRHPIALTKDLGLRNTLVFHLLMTGMAVSALVHPIILYFILARGIEMFEFGVLETLSKPLFLFDVFTILIGYFAFAWLAWRTLPVRRLAPLRSILWLLPAYWLMISAAAWRALWHLIVRPHEWEKTPHRLRRRR